jgi:cell division protein ZapE
LQRQKFLPAIALIKRFLKIINVDSGNDYRLREMASTPLFMLTADAQSDARMQAIFQRLSMGAVQESRYIEVRGREIPVRQLAPRVAWFDFNALCGGPRSQEDYLEIAHRFPTILISNIPQMAANEAAEAQRFIWLMDVLYDNRVKLVATSAVPPDKICIDKEKLKEFTRTASRLVEMQTQSYLALQHQTEAQSLHQLPHSAAS